MRRAGSLTCLLLALTAVPLCSQSAPSAADQGFRAKRIPFEAGFRVFIVPDMEGM